MLKYEIKEGDFMEKVCKAKNGIKIYSYKNPSLHSFFISLFFKGGSMYENAEDSGITHFLEHVSIRNVNKLMSGGLYAELDRLGLEFNASTFSEMVQFYLSGAKINFKRGAEIISKLLSPVILDKNEIDAERKRIKAEIRESDDKNSLSSFTNEITHKGTSLERNIVGSNRSVDKITRRRLENYRKSVFTKENLFVYVTGNFDDGDIDFLSDVISSYELGHGPAHENLAPVPEKFGKRDVAVNIKNADFTMVRFTFDIDMEKISVPETDLLYDILFSGYASRFFMEMSEARGMFYDINGALERYRNIGEMYFSFELREQDLYEAIEISVEILKKMKSEPLSDKQLMKASYVDNAYALFDDAREFNFTFAYDSHVMQLPYRTVQDRISAYQNVSAERIREVACEVFRPENLTLTMKGKVKKTDKSRVEDIIKKL